MLSAPSRPLKILTIDGGGLQAISTLLILDQLLDTIKEQNGAAVKPQPCDVFDVITGIGAGGWLALLLGRFRMDTETCMKEWYTLMDCIAPRSLSEGLYRRVLKHSYFDEGRLVERIKTLAEKYGIDDQLLDLKPPEKGCRFVFVAARQSKTEDKRDKYNLFRTYRCPSDAKVLPGPANPDSFPISRAFGATGAARYFSSAWKENISADASVSFLDAAFPKPHNITMLALNEMWALYGRDVPISVIVNIGPGFPTDTDMSWIARRFSWGLRHSPARQKPLPSSQDNGSVEPNGSAANHRPSLKTEDSNFFVLARAYGRRNARLQQDERDLEKKIKEELREHYAKPPEYHRLALVISPQGTAQNDARASASILRAVPDYLASTSTITSMEEISMAVKQVPAAC